MNDALHSRHFPGESDGYRRARNELLRAELELKERVEEIAAMRRDLPAGGIVPEDYIFDEGVRDFRDTQTISQVKLSELFEADKPTLVLINTMFEPDAEVPCPMCNMWADGYDAAASHLSDRINFALITKADIKKLRAWAAARGWRDIRLLSSRNNHFNRDYHTESDRGQLPAITVFHRDASGEIRHSYSIEAHFVPCEGDPRHIDLYSPVWNLLDLTPEGRGDDWYPALSYPR